MTRSKFPSLSSGLAKPLEDETSTSPTWENKLPPPAPNFISSFHHPQVAHCGRRQIPDRTIKCRANPAADSLELKVRDYLDDCLPG